MVKCPKCGSTDRFGVDVMCGIVMDTYGDIIDRNDDDIEGDTDTICFECGHSAPFYSFNIMEEDDADRKQAR